MHLIRRIRIPDDEFSILGGRDEMSPVRTPMHSVYLREVSFELFLRLHRQSRQHIDSLLRDIANYTRFVSSERFGSDGPARGRQVSRADIRVVSASSSFLRFILSLSASASRRAIWIFCWMDSAFISAILR